MRGENECRKIERHLGIELTKKNMPSCIACRVAKARRKNISTNKKKVNIDEDVMKKYQFTFELANKKNGDPNLKFSSVENNC